MRTNELLTMRGEKQTTVSSISSFPRDILAYVQRQDPASNTRGNYLTSIYIPVNIVQGRHGTAKG